MFLVTQISCFILIKKNVNSFSITTNLKEIQTLKLFMVRTLCGL